MTSYVVIIPFWSMAGTSFHVTRIEVDEVDVAETLDGGLAGAVERIIFFQVNHHLYQQGIFDEKTVGKGNNVVTANKGTITADNCTNTLLNKIVW